MKWHEIDGWLDGPDGETLRDLARARRVLEIGTYKGRSACCMAETALQVTAVDHHRGDAGTGPADTLGEFTRNVEGCRAASKVEPLVGEVGGLEAELRRRRFELVYIDGSHDAESVRRDTEIAADVVMPGGVIVWHDFDYPSVRAGIEATGLKLEWIERSGALGILRTAKWQVVGGLPWSLTIEPDAYSSFNGCSIGRFTEMPFGGRVRCGSLTHNFNMLLDIACRYRDEGRATHWFLHHSDIAAEAGHLDLLAEEMHLTNSVAISAVVAIKDQERHRTSTAVGSKSDPWEPKRYITMLDRELLPVTFTGPDVCADEDEVLLINTGLLLIDLRCDFWTDYTFRVLNRRAKVGDDYRCYFRSEDWEMSRDLDRAGLRYAATWRPYAEHIGTTAWTNRPAIRAIQNGVGA